MATVKFQCPICENERDVNPPCCKNCNRPICELCGNEENQECGTCVVNRARQNVSSEREAEANCAARRCESCLNLQPVYRFCWRCNQARKYYCVDSDCWDIWHVRAYGEDEINPMWTCPTCLADQNDDDENEKPVSRECYSLPTSNAQARRAIQAEIDDDLQFFGKPSEELPDEPDVAAEPVIESTEEEGEASALTEGVPSTLREGRFTLAFIEDVPTDCQARRCEDCFNLQPVYRFCWRCNKARKYYCVVSDCWDICNARNYREDQENPMWTCPTCSADKSKSKSRKCYSIATTNQEAKRGIRAEIDDDTNFFAETISVEHLCETDFASEPVPPSPEVEPELSDLMREICSTTDEFGIMYIDNDESEDDPGEDEAISLNPKAVEVKYRNTNPVEEPLIIKQEGETKKSDLEVVDLELPVLDETDIPGCSDAKKEKDRKNLSSSKNLPPGRVYYDSSSDEEIFSAKDHHK